MVHVSYDPNKVQDRDSPKNLFDDTVINNNKVLRESIDKVKNVVKNNTANIKIIKDNIENSNENDCITVDNLVRPQDSSSLSPQLSR